MNYSYMEAGNRCKDECLPEETNRRIVDIISDVNMAYSEHARRYLADTGLPKERTYVTGSPMAEVLHQNLKKIEASDIHARLGLEKGKYILLSAHREENIDTEKNFNSLFNAINKMAEKYDMPILYSCHPRSRKRLEQSGFQLDKRVIQHEPLGFHDYNCLQMNAFCVVSDSGTLPEESSFFTSVGHPFPAVCIRTSTERPEALDKGDFILEKIKQNRILVCCVAILYLLFCLFSGSHLDMVKCAFPYGPVDFIGAVCCVISILMVSIRLQNHLMTYHEDVAAVKDSFKRMLENGVYKTDLFSDL